MILRSIQNAEERHQIVLIVLDRFRHGLAHCLEGGEMNDCIDSVFLEYHVDRLLVTAVDLLEREVLLPGNFLHAVEACEVTVRKIVSDDHVIAGLDKFHGNMASDIARTTGNQNTFFVLVHKIKRY